MSSMLSAPATIPATSEVISTRRSRPYRWGTDRCLSTNARNPASRATAATGTSPAGDTRFGSSKIAQSGGLPSGVNL